MKAKQFEPNNESLLNKILVEKNPYVVKKLGRMVKNFDEKIWNNIRFDIMVKALRLKFSQNTDIKNKLIETGNKILYEASRTDKIWGIGYSEHEAKIIDKSFFGLNLLGKALMKVRKELL